MPLTLDSLRRFAVRRSLFVPRNLQDAIIKLGFVQADPLRAPARAQDLILRHRVSGYRAGDLEKHYPLLSISEDVLHVYGFMPKQHLALVHPRSATTRWQVEEQHPRLRNIVLNYIRDNGPSHPRDLARAIGKGAVVNGWGGSSSATTRMLEALQHKGELRVARRDCGIRVYDIAAPLEIKLAAQARAEGLVRLLVNLYAPLPEASLRQLVSMLRDRGPSRINLRDTIAILIKRGELRREAADGVPFIWPADEETNEETHEKAGDESERQGDGDLRLLAPFDPVVCDRRRFKLLWGWEYRFEAYTPAAKRRMGHYALPILWQDDVVGWANVQIKAGNLVCTPGLAKPVQDIGALRRALVAEAGRMANFLSAKPE